ncbi:MAG: NAD(P)-dependent alcohol dehydrogenase [Armatimonadota bacterium]
MSEESARASGTVAAEENSDQLAEQSAAGEADAITQLYQEQHHVPAEAAPAREVGAAGTPALGYAATSPSSPLEPFSFTRRDLGPRDVEIEILYCGVCHSDLHTARGEWGGTIYPVVPGHEIVGRVQRVGGRVTRFREGDLAGVGCMVDSCRTCKNCRDGLEQFCDGELILTYNSPERQTGGVTYGGYSDRIVVDEHFVLRISDRLDPAGAAPLLCAGITTYSPLRHWKVGPGQKVGIVGLGGLGHMGVKLAHAFGAHTVLFTTSPSKAQDAWRLGADEVVISRNEDEMQAHANSFDFILDTVAAPHNLDAYTSLLRRDGTLCLVGLPEHPHPSPSVANLIFKRRSIAGSLIGSIAETQEMLDFCAEHGITSDIVLIPIQEINEAYERMLRSDVKYRFVIDMASLREERAGA